MNQSSHLTRSLARQQESKTSRNAVVFRIYTENKLGIAAVTLEHFPSGATLFNGIGLFGSGQVERNITVEIVGTMDDMQKVVDLAAHIREEMKQDTVLVSWSPARMLTISAPSADAFNRETVEQDRFFERLAHHDVAGV